MVPRQPAGAGPLLLGVDAGTTNTKAIVVDAARGVIAVASEPTPIDYPRPEWAEYDGESLWQSSAWAIRGALAQVAEPERVAGIAFASMAETAVPLDAAGQPTGPAIAWFDKRTRAEVAEIERRIGADRLVHHLGPGAEPDLRPVQAALAPAAPPRGLRAHGQVAECRRLPGLAPVRRDGDGLQPASRTFALDVTALAWSAEVLEAMQVEPSLMAPLVASGRRLGTVSAEAAAATAFRVTAWSRSAATTTWSARLAADAMRPGVLLSSTGTTEAQLRAWPRRAAIRRWAAPASRRA